MTSRAEQEPVTERIKGHASMAGRQGVRILGGSLTLPFIFPRWLLVSCVVYRHPIDALKNCDTDIERALLNLAFHFRDYSHHAKSNCALSHATYTDLLDQFRLVMDTYR